MKRIVLFSGGSACRTINLALSGRKDVSLTRIVPAWDSGGSSKVIREKLDILSVGDIRQALMTMAHGEGCAGDVVSICNTRLSANPAAGPEGGDAAKEFRFYADGSHPLLERMEPGLRGAILNYLKTFATTVGDDFDFRNGSIGNFILTGACLAHNGDVNTAIFVFRKLCGIGGDVWPSSLDNDLVLSASLNDGRSLSPQDAITRLAGADAKTGIRDISLDRRDGGGVHANPAALEAIENADLIAFGPGSFYTSILPHLLVGGVRDAVQRSQGAKVLIGNILQCRETLGMTLSGVVNAFNRYWKGGPRCDAGPLHVLANRVLFPFEKTVGAFPYLVDDLNEASVHELNVHELVRAELEDIWNRGKHDGDLVAEQLLAISAR